MMKAAMKLVIDSHILQEAFDQVSPNGEYLRLIKAISRKINSAKKSFESPGMLREVSIFLSYKDVESDRPWVRDTYRHLSKKYKRCNIWFAKESLRPAKEWEDQIAEAIEQADVFIVFFSSDSIPLTGWHLKEVQMALEKKKRPDCNDFSIFPVRLDKVNRPSELAPLQSIDLFPDDGIAKFDQAIRELIEPLDTISASEIRTYSLRLCEDSKVGLSDTYERYVQVTKDSDPFKKWYSRLKNYHREAFYYKECSLLRQDRAKMKRLQCRPAADEVFIKIAHRAPAYLVSEAGLQKKCLNGHDAAECKTLQYFQKDMQAEKGVMSVANALAELSKL